LTLGKSEDFKQSLMTQPSEVLVPAHVHPDRLYNFIQQDVTHQSPSTDISERDFHPQSQVYKIPQRSKIRKKQFFGQHHATNANAIPLGTHKNRNPQVHNCTTELTSTVSNSLSNKENLDPQDKAESTALLKVSNEAQIAPTQPAINNNNNILNRTMRMAASMFSMSC